MVCSMGRATAGHMQLCCALLSMGKCWGTPGRKLEPMLPVLRLLKGPGGPSLLQATSIGPGRAHRGVSSHRGQKHRTP